MGGEASPNSRTRVAAIVEYDGARFSGWQRQENLRTVQSTLEASLSQVADEPVAVTVAGRTDAGVHASAQVVHFDTAAVRSPHAWVRGTNSNLPSDVAVLWAHPVPATFHARFSATGRRYRYLLINRTVRPTFLSGRVTHEYRTVDVERMRAAAQRLVGTHDFSSFRAAQCQAPHAVRELRTLDVTGRGEFIVVDAAANAFLHHMVRNLVGLLLSVGSGEHEPEWATEVLEKRDRKCAAVTAPPDGLYLMGVDYPEQFGIGAGWHPAGGFWP